jgi:hypothetical protein
MLDSSRYEGSTPVRPPRLDLPLSMPFSVSLSLHFLVVLCDGGGGGGGARWCIGGRRGGASVAGAVVKAEGGAARW